MKGFFSFFEKLNSDFLSLSPLLVVDISLKGMIVVSWLLEFMDVVGAICIVRNNRYILIFVNSV